MNYAKSTSGRDHEYKSSLPLSRICLNCPSPTPSLQDVNERKEAFEEVHTAIEDEPFGVCLCTGQLFSTLTVADVHPENPL